MKRTTLRPDQAAWLAETIERNRARFGGMRMMAEEAGKEEAGKDGKEAPKPEAGNDAGKLGDAGQKAIQSERDARKKAEQDLAALRGEFDGFKSTLTEAFGVKSEKGKETDVLASVQQQLAQIQAESSVLRYANEHGITDKDDLELLASATTDEARSKLATRLAAKSEESADGKKPGPRPDLSQGGKGDASQRESLPGVPRMAQAFEDVLNTK